MAANIHQILWVELPFRAAGVEPPVPALLMNTWLVMLFLVLVGVLATRKIRMVPGPLQNFFEFMIGGMEDFTVSVMGEGGRKVFPVVFTIFLFILCLNFTGLMPGVDAPTANINTNAAFAIFIFLYYNFWGIRIHGPKYIKHFMGPKLYIAPLMFLIEVISHLSRPLSLTLRLFGNIRGEEIVIGLLFFLAPVVSTLPIFFLFILMKFIQAFIFYILSVIYLQGAFHEAH